MNFLLQIVLVTILAILTAPYLLALREDFHARFVGLLSPVVPDLAEPAFVVLQVFGAVLLVFAVVAAVQQWKQETHRAALISASIPLCYWGILYALVLLASVGS
jgi:uncharacterized membrane protein YozB (DUF420 family)